MPVNDLAQEQTSCQRACEQEPSLFVDPVHVEGEALFLDQGHGKEQSLFVDQEGPAEGSVPVGQAFHAEGSLFVEQSIPLQQPLEHNRNTATMPPPPSTPPLLEVMKQPHFLPAASMDAYVVEELIHVRMVGPPHPGIDRLVFRKGPPGAYTFVTVVTHCTVVSPSTYDVIFEYNVPDPKALWSLYQHV